MRVFRLSKRAGGAMVKIEASSGLNNGVELNGSGAPVHELALPCQNTTYKRARSKYFSLPLAHRLADYAKSVDSPLMEKSYRNTSFCADVIVQQDGKLTSKYCGNRWCLVCSRVRTARAIKAYKPVVESWGETYMVTLTVRNVEGSELSATLGEMREKFAACLRAIRRTHGLAVTALRKLEITYNRRENTYHPHFHAIVDGQEQAELLRAIWLKRFKGRAELAGQDVRPCGEGSLNELFKYFTKLGTRDKSQGLYPMSVLHTIFVAMRGRRVWQPCGFTLPKEVEESIEGEVIEVEASEAFKRPDDLIYWQWNQGCPDWIDIETGELLSEYSPSDGFRELVETIETQSNLIRDSLPSG